MSSPFLCTYDAPIRTVVNGNEPTIRTPSHCSTGKLVDPNALMESDLGIRTQIIPSPILHVVNSETNCLQPFPIPMHFLDIRATAALSLPKKKARRLGPSNSLAPSIYRPVNVPADRRVLLWTTPYSLHMQSEFNIKISHRLQIKMFEGLLTATTHDTRQSYGAGLLRFNQFCDAESIPEGARMPASAILLGAFVAEFMGTL
ncbi:hypothetical protein F5877DRAFT_86976 [Lentinula edodes]|nr:hypothetical protein F5877DRAFT_86976 [Lentinula edodes]